MKPHSLLDTWQMFHREHKLSVDRMLCRPSARKAFLASARLATGIDDEETLLWSVVNLRKKKFVSAQG